MKKATLHLPLCGIFFGIVALLAGTAPANAVQWTGEGNDTKWSNPANWGPKGQPAATYPQGGASAEIIDAVVDLDVDIQIGSVTLAGSGNGGLIRSAGNRTMVVTGTLQISNGELTGGTDSTLTVNITSTATLKWIGGSFRQHVAATINNSGRIEWSGGPVFFNGTLNNDALGLFEIFGDHGFGSALRVGVINNAGRIIKQTGTGVTQFSGFTAQTNQIDTVLNNTGAILIASGTIEIGSGKTTGKFEIGDGKTLLVNGNGPHTFDRATLVGPGTCSIGVSTTFVGPIDSTAHIEISAGGIHGGNSTEPQALLTGAGSVAWKGGGITGTFTFDSGIRTVMSGGARKTFDGEITNRGTMIWAGGGPLATSVSTFHNEGTFTCLVPGTFLADTGISTPVFENTGTLNTAPGGENYSDDMAIVNAGVVNIGGYGQAGVLRTNRGFVQTERGVVYMEVGGTNGTTPEFDQIKESAQLSGGIVVELINGFTPAKDARFPLITNRQGEFQRVFTAGGEQRSRIEYVGSRVEFVSLSDAPIIARLSAAGRDLARNEVPDRDAELVATNARFPQWSYGYRSTAAGTALTLFTPDQHINDATGLHGWIANGQATLAVNTKNSPIVFNTGSGDYKPLFPEQIYMAPGSGNEFLVVRWTAPEAGDYRVLARWLDLDPHGGNGAIAYVVRNGTVEFDQSFESKANTTGRARLRARTFSLQAGEVLDFVVGSNGANAFDATAFNAAVRRVPKVTITTPATGVTVPEAQDVAIEAAVEHAGPIARVALTVNGETVATKDAPPYRFVHQFEPGTHYVRVIAYDDRKAPGTASPLKVTVEHAGSAAAQSGRAGNTAASAETAGKAATSGGRTYYCQRSGFWNEPSTWSPLGVPGINDSAVIAAGFEVTLTGETEVANLEGVGRINGAGFGIPRVLRVYGICSLGGELRGPMQFILPNRAKFFTPGGSLFLADVEFYNSGILALEGTGVVSERSILVNNGRMSIAPLPGTENPVIVGFGRIENNGKLLPGPNSTLIAPAGVKNRGALEQTPGYLISDNGAAFMGMNTGTLIGTDGSTLIGTDGSTLVGTDGGSLIGTDGSTLIGTDGATLIGTDGSTLIGTDGSTLISNKGGGSPGFRMSSGSASDSSVSPEADEEGAIILEGGTVTGIGELRGNVINRGGYISPGSSAGGIVVSGNYTQEAAGTLVLEIGGAGFATSYDAFQVAGTANLGGKLVVKTINNFTPAASASFSPLLYGNVAGSFASVSSNAQVTFNSTAMTTQVSGPNPPAPKALNISTRMRVEAGDNALIAGFIVTGNAPKKVLVRGIGPSLPVSGALADPILSLDNGAVTNDNWKSTQEQAIRDTTIPPSSDLESAIVATLQPGPHTAILRGKNNGTGVGLVEVYDLESGTPIQLANISTRGQVQTGDNVMIGGFIISGDYPAKVLLRAIGPSLTVPGKLEDPTLELVDANGATISNDDWRATQEAEIAAILPPSADRESAIIATLVPGFYTAIVRGKDDTIGVALVEGYNLQ